MNSLTARQNSSQIRYREMPYYGKFYSMIYWSVTISFIVVKGFIRPWVLENKAHELIQIFVLSYPNFCEAVIGSFLLVNGFMHINRKYVSQKYRLGKKAAVLLGLFLVAVYVITQEFKIHNLGGSNVYDPYDVLFSIFGLLISYVLLIYIHHPLHEEGKSKII